jgi:hypothetical protein
VRAAAASVVTVVAPGPAIRTDPSGSAVSACVPGGTATRTSSRSPVSRHDASIRPYGDSWAASAQVSPQRPVRHPGSMVSRLEGVGEIRQTFTT